MPKNDLRKTLNHIENELAFAAQRRSAKPNNTANSKNLQCCSAGANAPITLPGGDIHQEGNNALFFRLCGINGPPPAHPALPIDVHPGAAFRNDVGR